MILTTQPAIAALIVSMPHRLRAYVRTLDQNPVRVECDPYRAPVAGEWSRFDKQPMPPVLGF